MPDDKIADATARANSYASVLQSILPQSNGLPLFDLVILGAGKDGHIGSLYPGRKEVADTTSLVLSVDKVAVVYVVVCNCIIDE